MKVDSGKWRVKEKIPYWNFEIIFLESLKDFQPKLLILNSPFLTKKGGLLATFNLLHGY
ncbi:hypothetical protein [Clostridium botulinum]|uniref:hypothetical protein n=1 Tax=Clostridium botulinum TaxID=1491 RepID=UPI00138F48FD|nr:hypothetical protein [Clostridium botulinum]